MIARVRASLWGVVIGSGMVLRGDCVLVDESAEAVVSVDRGDGWLAAGSENAKFLACWAVQAPSGFSVMPARCTRLVEGSIKNRM
jgi:hypothetical protein